MLTSLGEIFLFGLAMATLSRKVGLPRIIGMLIAGMILGPYLLNLLSPSILDISLDLRKLALIVILLKAGLSLNISDLKKVGRPAALLSFVPASFEIIGFLVFAPWLLGVNLIEAAIIGSVLAAVSPAVIVPRMLNLLDNNYGKKKSIPQLIMAGASCDDIYVIVLFSTFVGIAKGGSVNMMEFANIPISVILGILVGAVLGKAMGIFFDYQFKRNKIVHNSIKLIIIFGVAFLLLALEDYLENKLAFSGLLAIISMACVFKINTIELVWEKISVKIGKLWLVAELILFVLVGAAVDITYTLQSGLNVILVILLALVFRSIGVMLCLIKTDLDLKERIFCVVANIPKATVQAAIGSVPLAMGLDCGAIVLTVAVTSIILTAPLGAILIDLTYRKLLHQDEEPDAKVVAEVSKT